MYTEPALRLAVELTETHLGDNQARTVVTHLGAAD